MFRARAGLVSELAEDAAASAAATNAVVNSNFALQMRERKEGAGPGRRGGGDTADLTMPGSRSNSCRRARAAVSYCFVFRFDRCEVIF